MAPVPLRALWALVRTNLESRDFVALWRAQSAMQRDGTQLNVGQMELRASQMRTKN